MTHKKFTTAPFKKPDYERRHRKNAMWCPYCGEWRVFKRNIYGTKSCPECTMCDNDFWVRTANKTWGFGVKPRGRGGGE